MLIGQTIPDLNCYNKMNLLVGFDNIEVLFWLWPPVQRLLWPQVFCRGCDLAAIWNFNPWLYTNTIRSSNPLYRFSWIQGCVCVCGGGGGGGLSAWAPLPHTPLYSAEKIQGCVWGGGLSAWAPWQKFSPPLEPPKWNNALYRYLWRDAILSPGQPPEPPLAAPSFWKVWLCPWLNKGSFTCCSILPWSKQDLSSFHLHSEHLPIRSIDLLPMVGRVLRALCRPK